MTIRDIDDAQGGERPFISSSSQGNTAGRIAVSRVKATGVYFTAASVESWAETPFSEVTLPRREHRVRRRRKTRGHRSRRCMCPGNDCRPLPAWGFYLRNVQNLTMANVRLTCQKDALALGVDCRPRAATHASWVRRGLRTRSPRSRW